MRATASKCSIFESHAQALIPDVKFNRRKLHLQKIEVKYMGQILLGEGLKADPNKIKA